MEGVADIDVLDGREGGAAGRAVADEEAGSDGEAESRGEGETSRGAGGRARVGALRRGEGDAQGGARGRAGGGATDGGAEGGAEGGAKGGSGTCSGGRGGALVRGGREKEILCGEAGGATGG